MIGIRGDETLARGDHRCEAALHVRGAAAVQNSVAHDRLERVGLPFFARPGRHDVGMTGEAQDRTLAAVARPEIFDGAERHVLDAETEGLQALPDELQAAVIFGADGGAADQVLGEGEGGVGVGRQSQGLQVRPRQVRARSYSEDPRWRQAAVVTRI